MIHARACLTPTNVVSLICQHGYTLNQPSLKQPGAMHALCMLYTMHAHANRAPLNRHSVVACYIECTHYLFLIYIIPVCMFTYYRTGVYPTVIQLLLHEQPPCEAHSEDTSLCSSQAHALCAGIRRCDHAMPHHHHHTFCAVHACRHHIQDQQPSGGSGCAGQVSEHTGVRTIKPEAP